MLLDGQIEAALVTLPVPPRDLYIKEVCEEKVMVCLRKDDPLANLEVIPKAVIADRLRIFVERSHQPMFYDKIMRKVLKSGITLQPTELVSAPSAMHFLVKRSRKMGLIN